MSLETRTRVLLLQHPRERRTPIGTARLAHLCLPGSELHVGVDFDNNPDVLAALAAAEAAGRPAHLLFPGPRSVDLATPDIGFVDIARGCRVYGVRVEKPNHVDVDIERTPMQIRGWRSGW